MKYGGLVIEKKEYVLLKRFMNLTGYYKDKTLRKSVEKLVGELESAQIRDEAEMPEDVIRFNSTVSIVSETGWRKKFKLVVPTESDVNSNKISILTPMGAAVIGYAQGDTLVWDFPAGEQRMVIEEVDQEHKYINLDII
ncbi:GreA/GreB family elongation factor [Zobellia galactanivorans]|uniref:Regulator of nucleoside diphosphate kinase n=1 Tax=Zobellia galactanivorans (strain DSM 12802 / CCUG 47099 / CIP 106680 / NCIMB 13871 / Dsij) TaxID=63186 RepID=G0L1A1_ZOBGA|nr:MULTISPECIES: GreA/GreB family elongation factor [Zobellia]MBU3024244.1 GreA/GreB family elongation factor [Zobellia galactanivorans]MDO6518758.1 GreA/GreB family elongation factor [Zobellia uliginosa]MDO6809685.1 GreA/GreB family elongation factor [Zobellia galactanivorans]OWW23295.1 transcription elongation factor GreAB [Zobellia sp. OII3]CAZ97730.1 Regulator of nucleoside diphosphate kinase [Zobellia galactanivorans]